MNIVDILAREFSIEKYRVENTLKLIEEGNTIPFIARYRKEQTGNLDDTTLRNLGERLSYLNNLKQRKDDVLRLIEEQGKLTEELKAKIDQAISLQEVEDLYMPFKQKRRTRATIAKERGLEPLANFILLGGKIAKGQADQVLLDEASKFINQEMEIHTAKDAIDGAFDIIAEIMSEDAGLRKYIRETFFKRGLISTKLIKDAEDENKLYENYYDYQEPVSKIVAHRILAVNRGENEKILRVKIDIEDSVKENILNKMLKEYASNNIFDKQIMGISEDSYKRLIYPSIEREIRSELSENAQERAIKVFGSNLNGLLMQAPIKGHIVMGFDPAYRTGCKIAVVDASGKLLDYTTIYPTAPQNRVKESEEILIKLIKNHKIDLIAIGNGTASRESEKFIADMIKKLNQKISYVIVNEAGASVYSASKLANEEHPDINVSIRGAISIARRLQDPMAELVKIEPRSIGVGQYQHDLNKKRLEEVLQGVVEDTVNRVGVDLNTASASLLKYVSGISPTIAKNIVAYRDENGEFKTKDDLNNVSRLGPQAFKLSSGFMRIPGARNPLENTGVHPELYKECQQMFKLLNISEDDLGNENKINKLVESYGIKKLSKDTGIGELSLRDIIIEISKPGRDIREDGEKPILRSDVLTFDDISIGMKLKGTVRNVVDFGAFVDIGIKNDGLVHISQLSDKFVKNPMDIVSVGDIVEVEVIGKDEKKQRISLSMKKS